MSVHPRRNVLAGLAGAAAGLISTQLVASSARAQATPAATPKPAAPKTPAPPAHDHAHMHDAPAPAAALPPAFTAALQAIVESTAACQRDGRICLAACTEHFAGGAMHMEACQRAVMNMLSVTGAMADVAGFKNASAKNVKALATACAMYCRACAAGCEPHKDHHAECKACMESCLACAKACEALPA